MELAKNEDAKPKIVGLPSMEDLSIREKINLWGYSQGAVFAERLSSIYPEVVSKLLSGGNAGAELIPDDSMDYPFGTRNFKELFGREFNEEAYKNIERV